MAACNESAENVTVALTRFKRGVKRTEQSELRNEKRRPRRHLESDLCHSFWGKVS